MEQSPCCVTSKSRTKQEFSLIFRNSTFITVFTISRQFCLSRARWIQFTPSHPNPLTFFLIYYSYLRLDLPKFLFRPEFSTKYCTYFSFLHASCLPHASCSIAVIVSGEEWEAPIQELSNFLHSPVTSPSLPKHLLSTQFKKACSTSSLSVII